MTNCRVATIAGLAMFAAFFGAGNLIFPLKIGMMTGDNYLIAFLGLMISGALIPLMGLYSMILYQGDRAAYFDKLGKPPAFALSLLALCLLGPFGVIPRCAFVAYDGITQMLPGMSFNVFMLIFFAAVTMIVWQKKYLISLLSHWLAPVKIIGVSVIALVAFSQIPTLLSTSEPQSRSFTVGLYDGYLTLDLIGALFFFPIISDYIKRNQKNKKDTVKNSLWASYTCLGVIAVIYICLVALGAHYSQPLASAKPEHYFTIIADLSLGKHAPAVLAVTLFFVCLATAASFTRIFAEFVEKDIARSQIPWSAAVGVTVMSSFVIASFGYVIISKLLVDAMTYVYPAMIVLVIAMILHKRYGFKYIRESFWATVALAIGYSFIAG